MTTPLVRQSFIHVQDPERDKQTKIPNFSFSRRRAAADLHQTLHDNRRGFPYNFVMRSVVSEPENFENFLG